MLPDVVWANWTFSVFLVCLMIEWTEGLIIEGVEGESIVLPCRPSSAAVWIKSGITILGTFKTVHVPDTRWKDVINLSGSTSLKITSLDANRDNGDFTCLTSEGEQIVTVKVLARTDPSTLVPPSIPYDLVPFIIGLVLGAAFVAILVTTACLCYWRGPFQKRQRSIKKNNSSDQDSTLKKSPAQTTTYEQMRHSNDYLIPVSAPAYTSLHQITLANTVGKRRVSSSMYEEIPDVQNYM